MINIIIICYQYFKHMIIDDFSKYEKIYFVTFIMYEFPFKIKIQNIKRYFMIIISKNVLIIYLLYDIKLI